MLSDAQIKRLLATARPTLRELFIVLEDCGARPGELFHATAADFDHKLNGFVYAGQRRRRRGAFAHKTARHNRDRLILLSGEALQIVRRLVLKYPQGPLLRNSKGRAWTLESIGKLCAQRRRKLNLPSFSAYSFRHTFATRFLERGGNIDTLAKLMGNTPETIRLHYSHLFTDRQDLRLALERNRAAAQSETRPLAGAGVSA